MCKGLSPFSGIIRNIFRTNTTNFQSHGKNFADGNLHPCKILLLHCSVRGVSLRFFYEVFRPFPGILQARNFRKDKNARKIIKYFNLSAVQQNLIHSNAIATFGAIIFKVGAFSCLTRQDGQDVQKTTKMQPQ